jgi:hypothetical protein
MQLYACTLCGSSISGYTWSMLYKARSACSCEVQAESAAVEAVVEAVVLAV